MLNLSAKELQRKSVETGFLENILEKAYRIVDILDILNENAVTKDKFVLKGGTALNLFKFDVPRLSIDIDLNYIAALSKAKMQEERLLITTEIKKIFSDEYNILIAKDVHALTQFAFHYRGISRSNDMIKLDINYLLRQPFVSPTLENCKLTDTDLSYLCLSFEELLAGKIIALLSRYTPKDLFDIYHTSCSIPDLIGDNLRIIKPLILCYGLIAKPSIFELIQLKFENMTQSDINKSLIPMLPHRTFLKIENLKEGVINFLEPLINLSDKEKVIIQNFYDIGELDINKIFSNRDIGENILKSPAFLWKKQNILRRI